ncbi:MAG: RluA family pseudouridine synthase [Elusimicrobia bacterium]|nr:RluA family pseudouridine synthase [Elusimicrobiota bacterium]
MSEERSFVFAGRTERLDRFLTQTLAPLSRTRIQRLIEEGAVTVNDRPAPARRLLEPGERIHVRLPDFSALPAAAAESVPILYEDADLIVVDKPAGLVVHPAGPHRTDTLIQRLWPKLAVGWAQGGLRPATDRPGVVHRLDKGTSGVMVIAKTPAAAENISRQFAERTVQKTYWALVQGILTTPGRVRSLVGRSRHAPQKMSTESGRPSEMEYSVIKNFPKDPTPSTLLEVHPRTGRTHQIRVQLAALGHPLIGDTLYGGIPGPHPLLHAHQLAFRHPRTGKPLTFQAAPPENLSPFLGK